MGSAAVQAHISMLQKIISRMSNNSANCKNWTITIVTAVAVLLINQDINIWICVIPIMLFYLIDCYYLGLERLCIKSQQNFLHKVSENNFADDLYTINELSDSCLQIKSTINAMLSFSTTPFYLIVALLFYLLMI